MFKIEKIVFKLVRLFQVPPSSIFWGVAGYIFWGGVANDSRGPVFLSHLNYFYAQAFLCFSWFGLKKASGSGQAISRFC